MAAVDNSDRPVRTRRYRAADQDAVVGLSVRAWEPVFASMRAALGEPIFAHLYGGDWRAHQAGAVRATLTDDATTVWVAEDAEGVVGFAAAAVADRATALGEIRMLAVDPAAQGRGTGTLLTTLATDWLREAGMRVAMIDTGGDPGHAPARRTYAKADYTPMPVARYFKSLT